jgi:2-C-methyl-D-erythritol 4-phosphate cytidylyltransferase
MIWSIVLAAGSGTRYGRLVPKQYEGLRGRRLVDWSLDAAAEASDGVVLVVAGEYREQAEDTADIVTTGGSTRAESVRRGLAHVPADAEVVIVHDAARPLATAALFAAVAAQISEGADAAVPGIPVTDTIKRVSAGIVRETVERSELAAVQTPQAFRAEVLRRAHAAGADATDDAALVEALGAEVVVVPGETANLKITHPHDLLVAEAVLDEGGRS